MLDTEQLESHIISVVVVTISVVVVTISVVVVAISVVVVAISVVEGSGRKLYLRAASVCTGV